MPTLADELVLLAITEEGGVASSASLKLDNGVAGAQLMELALRGRVRLEGEDVVVADAAPTGEPATDAVLAELAASERRRSAQDWIGRLSGAHGQEPVVDGLVERGVLTRERTRVLLVFPRTLHHEADPGPERDVRARLHAVLVDGREPDERTAALAALVQATDLLGEVVPDPEQRARAQERLRAGEGALPRALGAANDAVTQAVMAAVMVAVSAAITTTTATTIVSSG